MATFFTEVLSASKCSLSEQKWLQAASEGTWPAAVALCWKWGVQQSPIHSLNIPESLNISSVGGKFIIHLIFEGVKGWGRDFIEVQKSRAILVHLDIATTPISLLLCINQSSRNKNAAVVLAE